MNSIYQVIRDVEYSIVVKHAKSDYIEQARISVNGHSINLVYAKENTIDSILWNGKILYSITSKDLSYDSNPPHSIFGHMFSINEVFSNISAILDMEPRRLNLSLLLLISD